MMARSALIRAVFVVLLVLLATSAQARRNHRHRPRPRPRVNPINTCKEQSKCIRFTVKKIEEVDDRLCTDKGCAYKVCLILDTELDKCPKVGNNGRIASTCVAKANQCCTTTYRQKRNKGPYYKQCQIGAPDSVLKFYLGDGACSGSKTLRAHVANEDDAEEAVITCCPNEVATCTRDRIHECMWKVKLPPCPAPEQCKVRHCKECREDYPYKCAKCETGYYKKWWGRKCSKCPEGRWANWWPKECDSYIAETAAPDDVVDTAQTTVPEDDDDTAQIEMTEDDDAAAQTEEAEDVDDAAQTEEAEDVDDAAQADVPEDADNVAQGDVPQDV